MMTHTRPAPARRLRVKVCGRAKKCPDRNLRLLFELAQPSLVAGAPATHAAGNADKPDKLRKQGFLKRNASLNPRSAIARPAGS